MSVWKYTFGILLLILALVIVSFFQLPDSKLHIVACSVGQGDAILVTQGSLQILTDGGPDKSVLDCLGRHMPFWDREVELVISTHPDSDHSTGLTYVLQNYKVDKLLMNPIDPGTQIYEALRKEVGGHGIDVINPTQGMKLRLGLIYLDILGPTDEQLTRLTPQNGDSMLAKYETSGVTNLYSVIYRLSFKKFVGFFPGDMPTQVSDELAANWTMGTVDYIKVPHHGSNNGLTENLLKTLVPKVAVISLGKNSWGFPRPEILEMLAKYKVKVLRTDQVKDIEVVTDGESGKILINCYALKCVDFVANIGLSLRNAIK